MALFMNPGFEMCITINTTSISIINIIIIIIIITVHKIIRINVTSGPPRYKITSRQTGKCMTVAGGSASNDAGIQMWTCVDPVPDQAHWIQASQTFSFSPTLPA